MNSNHQPLILKYRPIDFPEVIGNQGAVAALADAVKADSRPHAYLFTGGSGLGKTTLARIIAKHIDASILEIDAASNSGIDDAKRLVELSRFRPILEQPHQLYIVDECHALSKAAWQALLKLIEEPPSYLYIAFCTTELQKVPETIRTRCYPVALRPLKSVEIEDLLQFVSDTEKWTVTDSTFQAIVQASEGSARKALSILQAGHAVDSREKLAEIIQDIDVEDSPIIDLAKYLMKGGRDWRPVSSYIQKIDDYEEAINVMLRYFAGAIGRSEDKQARDIYWMMGAFTETAAIYDKKVHFLVGIGKIVWGELPF